MISLGGGGGSTGSKEMLRALQQAKDLETQMRDQTRADQMPWYAAGAGAIGRLAHMTGTAGNKTLDMIKAELKPKYYVDGNGDGWAGIADSAGLDAEAQRIFEGQGEYQKDADYGSLMKPYEYQEDPGYQFAKSEGNKAIERRVAAQGKIFTPEAAKALSEYNTGVANQTYNDGFQRDQQTKGSMYNMLLGVSGQGQNSAGVISQDNANYADDVGNYVVQEGNVKAADIQAKKAAKGSMFNTLVNTAAGAGIGYMTGGWGGAATGALKGVMGSR